jgi:endonuclease G
LEGLNVNQENITKRPSFFIEKDLPKDYQVSSDDYIRSGYDRGHLAPDASFDYNNEDLKIIYTMANIIPQDPNVNREFWSKAEKYEREMAVSLGEVKVINLVLFDSKPLYIKDKIAISKGFIKGIFNSNQGFERCFYYDNFVLFSADKDTLDQHEIACNTVF